MVDKVPKAKKRKEDPQIIEARKRARERREAMNRMQFSSTVNDLKDNEDRF